MSALDPLRVSLEGKALIEASAGTGKTHTITTLVLRLLLERGLDIRGVLVLTYTRAATAELRDRIRRRLAQALALIERPEDAAHPSVDDALRTLVEQRSAQRTSDLERLAQALRDFDEAPIFTIHGFCQRVLGECALESRTPLEIDLVEDGSALIDEVATDLWEQQTWSRDPGVLHQLLKCQMTLPAIRQLVRAVVQEPAMPIIPELGVEPPVVDRTRFDAAIAGAGVIWRIERERILDLLTQEGVLSKTTHNPERVRGTWAPTLDRLCASPSAVPLPEIFDLSRLTPAGLYDGANKKMKARTPVHPFFEACVEPAAAQAELRDNHKVIALHVRGVIAREARKLAVHRKAQRGVQGFEDLLEWLSSALRGPDGQALAARIAARYPALLVDEFQDTDPTQYAVFETLASRGTQTVLLIGDPKQAIYSFRGADVFAYAQAVRDAGERVHRLDTNFRSDPQLVHALNTVFTASAMPFGMDEVRYEPVGVRPRAEEALTPPAPSLQFLFVRRDAAEVSRGTIAGPWANQRVPQLVASEIAELVRSRTQLRDPKRGVRDVLPADVAVLCRTNAQGREVQVALSALGVAAAFDGDNSVFESDSAEELQRVLIAIARPGNRRALRSALATKLLGFTADELIALDSDEERYAVWIDRFGLAHKTWLEHSFVQAIHALLIDARSQQRLLLRRDGQRRLTDALHAIELLHLLATQEHLGPLGLARRLGGLREGAKELSGGLGIESAQLRLESDEHAVRITTVHRSKGLQYPIVFCPNLWSAYHPPKPYVSFHDAADAYRRKLDLVVDPDGEHATRAKEEEKQEAVRLAYVALTRAQHRCYVVWGGFHGYESSPLAALLHDKAKKGALDDDALQARLRELARLSGGAIGVRDAILDALPLQMAELSSGALRARTFSRKLEIGERLTSFSRLTRAVARARHESLAEGPDHDLEPAEVALDRDMSTATRVVLNDFPAGASAGTLIHSVYEQIDFRRSDAAELPARVQAALAEAQLDTERLAAPLVQGIADSLRTPLDASDPTFTLSAIGKRERVNELEFMLELERGSRLERHALAALLERFGAPASAPGYAERVRMLREGAAEGFLRGFIDLVMRRGERFYVVDYKSNHLGPSAEHYAQPRLAAEMQSHHYFLQAYLYTLALHRYLQRRLPDYDYDRHIGGFLYLFVRGMSPSHAIGTGIYAERPSRALIEGLSDLLRTPEGA